MTENTSSAVGRAAIDAYLDSVEQALLAAHAPRGDRVQVRQDLESQIADMLAGEPQPLTEEIVQAVIAKLEPPSHFAATYGNGNGNGGSGNGNGSEPGRAWAARITRRPVMRWPLIAAVSCACLCFGCLLLLISGGTMFNDGPLIVLILSLLLVGFVLTPIAVWKGVKQLQSQSDQPRDRELVIRSAMIYCVILPVLVTGFFALATEGFILIPIGLGAFIYLQVVLVRRLHRRLSERLPAQASDAGAHAAERAVGTAMTMQAM
jgi:hypothetical protein